MVPGWRDVWPVNNKNPDCLFFEENMPGVKIPGCEERLTLIGPSRQQTIALAAAHDFFGAFLDCDPAAFGRLVSLPERYPEASLIHAV